MAKVSIIDIENAFDFVNFDNLSDNEAAVDRETGEIYFWSSDLEEELPDDFDIESESLVLLPDKRDLDLGSKLAIDFAREFCPDDFEEIIAIFSHPGAYAHFKRLLERKNRLKEWYNFEQEKIRAALIDWCKTNEIELEK